jgi:hypothetical protein
MPTRKLTVRLPEDEIEFAKSYASSQGITLTELIDRYFKQLRLSTSGDLHPDILRFSGIIPSDIESRNDYLNAIEEKHR